jgi:predicted membrane protein (TIGR00267 family)
MLEKFRTYAKITNLWPIARRYFVNNFYDGMLTVLGILLGFFVIIFQSETHAVNSRLVIFTGLGTSISMFLSGLTGSYLSEKAERRKLKDELNKAMILDELKNENLTANSATQDIEKAMLMKIDKKRKQTERDSDDEKLKKKGKTILERAEFVTSIVVAFVNGLSPFLGGLISLIPFFFQVLAGFVTFLTSFIIILISIILLGIFLGLVSKESIIKNILQMLFAFGLTIGISILILGA